MATIDLTRDNFESTVGTEAGESKIVLVDFWAAWCGPCQRFGPVFEAASEKHPDVVFAKVDTEVEAELAGTFGIRSIPTLLVVRDGLVVFQQAGALPADVLEDLIAQVRALDMDAVRAQVAEHLARESQEPGQDEG